MNLTKSLKIIKLPQISTCRTAAYITTILVTSNEM
jgi:hypothetical protein